MTIKFFEEELSKMKELKSIKIIAVDHGYGSIKTTNTVTLPALLPMTQNRFSPVTFWNTTAPITASERDTKEFIPDKAMDGDYYLLTLMAVARG